VEEKPMDIRQLRLEENSNDKKRIPTSKGWFTLWLEFELWDLSPLDDPSDDFFNMAVKTNDGRSCELDVWTFKFLKRAREENQLSGDNLSGQYLKPPDLFVEREDRELLEEVVKHMIENDELEEYFSIYQLGFCVAFTISQDICINEQNTLYMHFRNYAIEENKLAFSGVKGKSGRWEGFVTSKITNKPVTEEDRKAVENWLNGDGHFLDYKVGPIEENWEQEETNGDI